MDKKKFKKFLCLHAVPLVLFFVYSAVLSYCSYKGGVSITESNGYFGVRFLMLILFLPILFVFLVYYIIILFAIEKKYILPSIALMIISSFIFVYTFTWGMVSCPVKGYYKYVQKNVDIDEIHQWLVNYEQQSEDQYVNDDGFKRDRVYEQDWPEEIKKLNPSRGVFVFEKTGKRYITISHGVDWELSIGLCIMEEPMDVPIGSRIELQDNAFVWAGQY